MFPGNRRRAFALAGLLFLAARSAAAQDWLILGGVGDVEVWATDSGSRLLTRNDGRPGILGRLQVWGGIAPTPIVQLVALGYLEAGPARRGRGTALELEGVVLRVAPSRFLVIEGGKILSPVGAFGPRRLSLVNPLIDRPDTYPPTYPWGAQVSGESRVVDYRLAVVSLPVSDQRYLPAPGHTPRLAAGIGLTPAIGVHLGASYTRGPYLSPTTPFLPPGVDWKTRRGEIIGLDARASRGYFEFQGELMFTSYEAPTTGLALKGTAGFGELKYTWTPRFFTAVRAQRNRYAFIQVRNGRWIENLTTFVSGELGIGLRVDRHLLVKASYQQDDWDPPASGPPLLNGRAVAVQLSYAFDVADWLVRRR